ncbi:MAG: sugar porter family MFS transporter, partial [Salinivirgaceae bacterium]
VKFIELEFSLTKMQLGWAVSSLTLTSTLAMMVAGPVSDRIGRKRTLFYAALLYAISAIASAFAPTFIILVIARMIGGIGVGASLILAPMYIAEIVPGKIRGQMVSLNQLNIVVGISVAFFTNYLILRLGKTDLPWVHNLGIGEHNWRWMLGLEFLPAVVYFFALFAVPRSPRWLVMKGKLDEAIQVLKATRSSEVAEKEIELVKLSLNKGEKKEKLRIGELFKPALKLVLTIGIVVAVLQQITGINSVFFYAPMIFEQTGIGTDASFSQAIIVGLTNLVFTVLAILFIDKLGRKPLLIYGVGSIALFMFILSYGFSSATYKIDDKGIALLPAEISKTGITKLKEITYHSDIEFKSALKEVIGETMFTKHEAELVKNAINANAMLILIGIIGFVAAFAISIGPVMWVLFSELFPNKIRGLAISFVGLINSAVSFSVQLVFPWELSTIGNASTFMIYGVFAVLGLAFIIMKVPETKGKSLEELEIILTK